MSVLFSQMFLAFVFVIVGFIGGAVMVILWTEREKKMENLARSSSLEQSIPVTQKETPTEQKANIPFEKVPKPQSPYQQQVQLFRNPSTKEMAVDLEGKLIKSADKLPLSRKQELVELTIDWLTWLGMNRTSAAREPSTQPAVRVLNERLEVAVNPIPLDLNQQGSPHTTSSSSTAIGSSLSSQSESQPIPAPLNNPVVHMAAKPPSPPKVQVKSGVQQTIAEQINAILQDMLQHTPGSADISISEDNNHVVYFWVSGIKYDGIDSISNPEAQKIVRSAISEWETRNDLVNR